MNACNNALLIAGFQWMLDIIVVSDWGFKKYFWKCNSINPADLWGSPGQNQQVSVVSKGEQITSFYNKVIALLQLTSFLLLMHCSLQDNNLERLWREGNNFINVFSLEDLTIKVIVSQARENPVYGTEQYFSNFPERELNMDSWVLPRIYLIILLVPQLQLLVREI